VIEHNMDFIMRAVPARDLHGGGQVLAEGPPQAVQSNRQVLEAYLGN
jgi:branched-chain amino acid transport system ATP-binding protein